MFSTWRALRFGVRLACVQSVHHNFSPIAYKANQVSGTIVRTCHHNRLAHKSDDRKELGKLEGKMKLMFTCKKCRTRNSKLISKLAYNKGVIIIRCDGCKNNHLIADNLGWFSKKNDKINIEKLMALKGESVRKINDTDGYYEAILKEELKLHQQNAKELKDSSNAECPEEIKKLNSKES